MDVRKLATLALMSDEEYDKYLKDKSKPNTSVEDKSQENIKKLLNRAKKSSVDFGWQPL